MFFLLLSLSTCSFLLLSVSACLFLLSLLPSIPCFSFLFLSLPSCVSEFLFLSLLYVSFLCVYIFSLFCSFSPSLHPPVDSCFSLLLFCSLLCFLSVLLSFHVFLVSSAFVCSCPTSLSFHLFLPDNLCCSSLYLFIFACFFLVPHASICCFLLVCVFRILSRLFSHKIIDLFKAHIDADECNNLLFFLPYAKAHTLYADTYFPSFLMLKLTHCMLIKGPFDILLIVSNVGIYMYQNQHTKKNSPTYSC